MNEHFDVAVIGGGIAGLAAAYGAQKAGANVVLIEAHNRIGGVISSKRIDGFLIEEGPNSLSANGEVLDVLHEIGLRHDIFEPPDIARRRYVVRNSVLHALPSSPPAFIASKLLSISGKLRALAEPFAGGRPQVEESLAALVRRRFGQELLDYFVDPFVNGVYAGNPDELSSEYAMRMLMELERAHGSILMGAIKQARSARGKSGAPRIVSFRNGMVQLPEAFGTALRSIRLESVVTKITQTNSEWCIEYQRQDIAQQLTASSVIVAVPAHAVTRIGLPSNVTELLEPLSAVNHAPVATVSLGFKRTDVKMALDGFGMLVPNVEESPMLGTLFSSSMFAERAPGGHVLLTCFVGGARRANLPSRAEAVKIAVAETGRLLEISSSPVLAHVALWKQGIPQFNLGYSRVLESVAKAENVASGLYFDGSYRAGVAIGDCVMKGIATGARAASHSSVAVTF